MQAGDVIYKGATVATINETEGTQYALVTFHSGVGLFAGRQDWIALEGWDYLGANRPSDNLPQQPADPGQKAIRP